MAAIHHPLGHARRSAPLGLPVGQPNWWVLAAIGILGLSAMLPVLQNSAATSSGFRTQESQGEIDRMNGDIRLLESDVAGLTSLARIQQRATEIGLAPGLNPFYVTIDQPGPAPAKLPSEFLPAPTPTRSEPESWWRSLLSRVPLPR